MLFPHNNKDKVLTKTITFIKLEHSVIDSNCFRLRVFTFHPIRLKIKYKPTIRENSHA